jgi:hypothetical protein
MKAFLLVFGSFEAGVFAKAPMVFGGRIVDGRLKDGLSIHTAEQFGRT